MPQKPPTFHIMIIWRSCGSSKLIAPGLIRAFSVKVLELLPHWCTRAQICWPSGNAEVYFFAPRPAKLAEGAKLGSGTVVAWVDLGRYQILELNLNLYVLSFICACTQCLHIIANKGRTIFRCSHKNIVLFRQSTFSHHSGSCYSHFIICVLFQTWEE